MLAGVAAAHAARRAVVWPSCASARRPTSCPASPSRSTPTTPVPGRRPGCGSAAEPPASASTARSRPTICGPCWPGCAPGAGGLSPNGTTIKPAPQPGARVRRHVQGPRSRPACCTPCPTTRGCRGRSSTPATTPCGRRSPGWNGKRSRCTGAPHNMAWVDKKRAELIAAGEDPSTVGPHRLKTSGVVAAAFRHRTSRAGDPLLHWHVLIANLVEGADGRWSAFAHPDLYRHARAAGEVFQAAFRAELTRTLGVEWRPGRHVPEIAGVPQGLLDQFSKRRAEIEAWLEATGTADRRGRAAGGGAGDPAQQAGAGRGTARRRLEAARPTSAGWGPAQADALIAELQPTRPDRRRRRCGDWPTSASTSTAGPSDYERVVTPDEWIADLLRSDLTVTSTTFTDTDVVASRRRNGSAPAPPSTPWNGSSTSSSPPTRSSPVDADDGRERYTSREIARRRTPLPRRRSTTDGGGPGRPGARRGGDRGARPTLGDDQAAAVRHAVRADGRRGRADRPGRDRQDLHPRHRPRRLRAGRVAGDRRRPVGPGRAGADRRRQHPGPHPAHPRRRRRPRPRRARTPTPCSSSTKPGWPTSALLDQIVTTAVERGGRVVLVGDQHQMPSIGAGGGFAYAAEHGRCVAELTVNRRQREQWEQEALPGPAQRQRRRTPSPPTATTAGSSSPPTPTTMVADAIARWTAAIDAGLRPGDAGRLQRPRRPAQPGRHRRPRRPRPAHRRRRRRQLRRRTATGSGTGSPCAATATANAPSTATASRSPTASSAPSSPSTAAGSPSASTATPTSTSSWTSATWPVAARSATATPSPPTAPRAAPGTCRSPSASTASTGKPPTPTCPAASPRTG